MSEPAKKNRHQYQHTFKRELERLNPSQQSAVQQIEGPVLVIAGPGTGKTHILSARIGRILMDTDTQAANILCLTFTDAGVRAMRQRLLEFIGPEAHRVHIYTFHSFCNTIIQDNLELFGHHDLEPLSDLERVEILRKLIDELAYDHPLKAHRADVYFYEKQLFDLFKRMKSEAWTVADVEKAIVDYLEDLPSREEFIYKQNRGKIKKGDLKQAKIDDLTIKMKRLSAATELFPRYQELMREYRRYDFEDMIMWVLEVFENNEAVLRTYQEQYLYFLIDEFQDTNGSQNKIVQRLIEYWENPNIFIVGDDDQSIYEFQGARLKNLMDFYTDYEKDLHLVLLKDNYRSSQHILDTSRALIDQNEHRLVQQLEGLQKKLEAQNKDVAHHKVRPSIISYPNRMQEDADIANQIIELQEKGIALEEVAVIYARHKQAENIINILEKKGVSYNTKRQVNILDLPMIQNVRNLLQYLNEENQFPFSGEARLFPILHYSFLKIPAADLARLSVYQAKQDYNKKTPWRSIIADPEILGAAKVNKPEAFLKCSKFLEELLEEKSGLPLPVVVERLINRSGLLEEILSSGDKTWKLQQLHTLVDFVKKETDRHPRLRLPAFIETLRQMDANRLSISLQKNTVSSNGVNLLTAHSSKGLEFRYVFILDCTKKIWEPRRNNAGRFPFPDTLTFSGEEDAMEARRRLFYVAMTRAKTFLQLSFSREDRAGKLLEPSRFVGEIASGTGLDIELKELPEDRLLETQMLLLKELQKPVLPMLEKAQTASLLENFALSVSSLNQYLRCPLSFFYEHILRVPNITSPSAAYGTAMHYALRRVFDRMKQSEDKVLPSVEEFVRFFVEEMHRQQGFFVPKEFRRRLEMGQRHLEAYYEQHKDNWTYQVQVELSIRNVEMKGVPLVGTIDKLEIERENIAYIVDYKTGSHQTKKVKPPSAAEPNGGIYWRQLHFYKILFEESQSQRLATQGAIAYLEPDAKGIFPSAEVVLDAQGQNLVKLLITDTYKKIKAHDFYEGCGEDSCKWCNFVKNNIPQNSFNDTELEEMDD